MVFASLGSTWLWIDIIIILIVVWKWRKTEMELGICDRYCFVCSVLTVPKCVHLIKKWIIFLLSVVGLGHATTSKYEFIITLSFLSKSNESIDATTITAISLSKTASNAISTSSVWCCPSPSVWFGSVWCWRWLYATTSSATTYSWLSANAELYNSLSTNTIKCHIPQSISNAFTKFSPTTTRLLGLRIPTGWPVRGTIVSNCQ